MHQTKTWIRVRELIQWHQAQTQERETSRRSFYIPWTKHGIILKETKKKKKNRTGNASKAKPLCKVNLECTSTREQDLLILSSNDQSHYSGNEK